MKLLVLSIFSLLLSMQLSANNQWPEFSEYSEKLTSDKVHTFMHDGRYTIVATPARMFGSTEARNKAMAEGMKVARGVAKSYLQELMNVEGMESDALQAEIEKINVVRDPRSLEKLSKAASKSGLPTFRSLDDILSSARPAIEAARDQSLRKEVDDILSATLQTFQDKIDTLDPSSNWDFKPEAAIYQFQLSVSSSISVKSSTNMYMRALIAFLKTAPTITSIVRPWHVEIIDNMNGNKAFKSISKTEFEQATFIINRGRVGKGSKEAGNFRHGIAGFRVGGGLLFGFHDKLSDISGVHTTASFTHSLPLRPGLSNSPARSLANKFRQWNVKAMYVSPILKSMLSGSGKELLSSQSFMLTVSKNLLKHKKPGISAEAGTVVDISAFLRWVLPDCEESIDTEDEMNKNFCDDQPSY
ncbi:MAG: hypothetical protein AB8E15_08870 [Bdellovibrionales bacterium]